MSLSTITSPACLCQTTTLPACLCQPPPHQHVFVNHHLTSMSLSTITSHHQHIYVYVCPYSGGGSPLRGAHLVEATTSPACISQSSPHQHVFVNHRLISMSLSSIISPPCLCLCLCLPPLQVEVVHFAAHTSRKPPPPHQLVFVNHHLTSMSLSTITSPACLCLPPQAQTTTSSACQCLHLSPFCRWR